MCIYMRVYIHTKAIIRMALQAIIICFQYTQHISTILYMIIVITNELKVTVNVIIDLVCVPYNILVLI